MNPGPVAFIADIHGNIWALAAVLADIRRRGITRVLDLGDSVYGPLEPELTAHRLACEGIPSLRGNQDRVLLEPPPSEASPTLLYTLRSLSPAHLHWLRWHPLVRHAEDIFCCHGTPT